MRVCNVPWLLVVQRLDQSLTHSSRRPQTGDDVTPQAGRVTIFQHDLYHTGASAAPAVHQLTGVPLRLSAGMPVSKGCKYTIRCDVEYAL